MFSVFVLLQIHATEEIRQELGNLFEVSGLSTIIILVYAPAVIITLEEPGEGERNFLSSLSAMDCKLLQRGKQA